MLDITTDIQSLTTFRRRSGDFMRQLKRSKRPVMLTVKGKAAAIVQDAEAYQRLLDIAAGADADEGIRQGLKDAKAGRLRPAKGLFPRVRSQAWRTSLASPPAPSATLSASTDKSMLNIPTPPANGTWDSKRQS
jgi:prevent-host-death family protein